MKFLQIIILSGLTSILPFAVIAQTAKPLDQHLQYDSISFPPLAVMIDSAIAHNATLKYLEQSILAKKIILNMNSKSWTKNFGIQADIRYGTFDNFSTNTAEGQSPALMATKATQTNYGVGAYLKLPLADFVTHKNQIDLARMEIDQAETMAEVQRDQIRQMVIKQYNDLVMKLSLLKIKARNLETSRMNMVMAEKEFQNGVIPLGAYSSMSETAGNAEVSFIEAKVDFKTAYMLLEELVGFKFNITVQ